MKKSLSEKDDEDDICEDTCFKRDNCISEIIVCTHDEKSKRYTCITAVANLDIFLQIIKTLKSS